MAKNINIHIKSTGAQQTKQDIDGVAHSTEKMGEKTQKASKGAMESLKSWFGAFGVAAVAAIIAGAATKVAKFFDDIKTRSDEAVRAVQDVRKEFSDLFEALDAFDEKTREAVTKSTNALLQKTGASSAVGLPVVNAYTRQFRELVKTGQLTQGQYNQGLEGMLGYAERHGGAATPDLIALMAGWGMTTPQQQGEFRRQIAAGAAASGLTDAELIAALGRGMPTIKAMEWSPTQAVGIIATIASGETGRQKAGLPATTLQGLLAPQDSNLAKYGISEKLAQDPQQLLMLLQQKRGQMSQQAFISMLTDIYGTTAAAGVSKLLTASRGDIGGILMRAAGPEGIAAEQAEEEARKTTLETLAAKTEARKKQLLLDLTSDQKYMEKVREIGAEKRAQLRRDEPYFQWFRERFTPEEIEKEEAAFREWLDTLSLEEKARIREEHGGQFGPIWWRMSPQEKFEALTRQRAEKGPVSMNNNYNYDIHYHHEMIFNPIGGTREDRLIGPRMPTNIT